MLVKTNFGDALLLDRFTIVIQKILQLKTQKTEISVYPNPSTGKIYFNAVENDYRVEVYNVLGQIINSSRVDQDNYCINLNAIPQAVYFYRITEGSLSVQQGKIVIER